MLCVGREEDFVEVIAEVNVETAEGDHAVAENSKYKTQNIISIIRSMFIGDYEFSLKSQSRPSQGFYYADTHRGMHLMSLSSNFGFDAQLYYLVLAILY
jgi:hypothetical protein